MAIVDIAVAGQDTAGQDTTGQDTVGSGYLCTVGNLGLGSIAFADILPEVEHLTEHFADCNCIMGFNQDLAYLILLKY